MRGENIGEREGRANGKGEKSKEPLTQIAVSFIGVGDGSLIESTNWIVLGQSSVYV